MRHITMLLPTRNSTSEGSPVRLQWIRRKRLEKLEEKAGPDYNVDFTASSGGFK